MFHAPSTRTRAVNCKDNGARTVCGLEQLSGGPQSGRCTWNVQAEQTDLGHELGNRALCAGRAVWLLRNLGGKKGR